MGIKRLSITWNAVRVFQALGLMAVGLLTPLIFTERNFRIYDLLYQAMNELDSGFLALGAIHLIALNTLRSGPDYLAITLLMDGISIQWNGPGRSPLLRFHSAACSKFHFTRSYIWSIP